MTPHIIIRDFGLTPASSSLRWLIAADAIEEIGRVDIAASIRAGVNKDCDSGDYGGSSCGYGYGGGNGSSHGYGYGYDGGCGGDGGGSDSGYRGDGNGRGHGGDAGGDD